MAGLFYMAVAACCGISLIRWRWGIYAAVLFDAVRDPARKLTPDFPLLMTLAPAAVWAAVFAGLLLERRGGAKAIFRAQPGTKRFVALLVAALLPGAAVAAATLPRGPLVAAFGAVSYLAPLLGLAIGFAFAHSAADVRRIAGWYCAVNAAMLISVPAERFGWGWQGLGGIEMEWVRYHGQEVIPLISGWYRSPDTMGLRAAHLMMFAATLAVHRPETGRRIPWWGWLLLVVWGGACLVLCGRRKMIGVPVVFVGVFAALQALREGWVKAVGMAAAGAGIAAVGIVLTAGETGLGLGNEDYLASTLGDSTERLGTETVSSIDPVLRQYGLLGNGLGSATQGHHYVAGRNLAWPESMGARVLTELGLPGTVLLVCALLALLGTFAAAVPRRGEFAPHARLQTCLLAMLAAAAACMTISHQSFSGDPMEMLLLLAIAGFVLRLGMGSGARSWGNRPPGPAQWRRANSRGVHDAPPSRRGRDRIRAYPETKLTGNG
ncbi:hypothetical protein [Alienimonas chondri]|uniref:O-antigen ligase n=1 Tax=Alienimonas chondri TaxID=2681879 RepID=A0ABX1VF81_9PLAN|nr:hypothetical protein [Alienimonas chondri]NNJ26389.1 hypothetical protein [Alienimonas chondri]